MYCTGKASGCFFRHEMSDLFDQSLQVGKYRLYDEGEVVTRFIHRVPKARGVLIA